ncbi:MAG: cobalt ECF transporter T component CbiQ [Chloroflexi bacterium RBG_16_50_9]|nr:MAG: cobalt ECF transporter T component CbiQ [Chloroflexi bacterium RBG_16_50_9]
MKHSFLDKYSEQDSLVHRLDPRTKFIISLLFILAVALTSPVMWPVFSIYFILMIILILISRVPVLYILKRSLVIIPFVVLMAISIPFVKEGEVIGSYNIWIWQVSLTHSGLQLLWNILAKAWLSILCLILLTATTRMTDLLAALERLHMPRVMVMILSFMYRYIFVLVDEVMRMKQARDSRNFGGRRLWQLRTLGNMAGTLFIRSYERGERVYAAMLARGYDGRCCTLNRLSLKPTDIYGGLGFGIVILAAFLFNFIG